MVRAFHEVAATAADKKVDRRPTALILAIERVAEASAIVGIFP
jgi:hypothetical protein